MRSYIPEILDEIKDELTLIWKVQTDAILKGKMRIYSCQTQEYWKSHEPGYELWFGPDEIDEAVEKIKIFYQDGKLPNSAFLLDPVVYEISDKARPKPLGSAVLWGSVFCEKGQEISEEALKRVTSIGVFTDFFHYKESNRFGIKMLAFLKEPVMPMNANLPPDGSIIPGVQSLIDLIDINSDAFYSRHYLLSGLEYRLSRGAYQHPSFRRIFGDIPVHSVRDITEVSIHLQKIKDAGICWNAYERDQNLYARYGIDISNLEGNLARKKASDEDIEEVRHEIALIWDSQKRHSELDGGIMRLYSAPTQANWRAKLPGIEVWFGSDEEEIDSAIKQIQLHYNAGILPNSPLLLDPVVYKKEGDDYIAIGTGIVWSTALATGNTYYDEDALSRVKDLGLLAGFMIRAGTDISGIKAIGFLDKPYLFSKEEVEQHKKNLEVMAVDFERKKKEDEERRLEEEKNRPQIEEDVSGKKENVQVQAEVVFDVVGRDALPIPGCKELFDLANFNADTFAPYYLLAGLEYLCTNGAFSNEEFPEKITLTASERKELIDKYTVSLDRILDGGKCWEGYSRLHQLWKRFGYEASKLEANLKYFHLCGKDLDFLSLTGAEDDDGAVDEKFEFFLNSWIPKGSITLLVATGGTGRSTLAHRLAVISAVDWKENDELPSWLGTTINPDESGGLIVYFSGKDSPGVVKIRTKTFDPNGQAKRLLTITGNDFGMNHKGEDASFDDFFKRLNKLPDVSLIIIDPSRKYITGDINKEADVGRFFNTIEEFAIKKDCAVLVVHNLEKKITPTTTKDLADSVYGSEVFLDRSRVIIGLMQEGDKTIAGLAKSSIPVKLGMVDGERLFTRDPNTLDFTWISGDEGVRGITMKNNSSV